MSKRRKRLMHQEATATIESLSHDGRGVAHIDGKTIFIFGALADETVKFRYTSVRSRFDEGTTTEVITPSPLRVEPRCEFFGICGGCALQHLNLNSQIEHKQNVFLERLLHQAKLTPKELMPPITASEWGYRHKARLSVRYVPGKNKVLVGFRERQANYVANINRCDVLEKRIGLRIEDLSDLLYKLETRSDIAQIEVAITEKRCAIILRHLKDLPETDLALIKDFAKENQIDVYLQPKGYDSIHLFYPEDANPLLEYNLKDNLKMQFHPAQFTQINPEINLKMIDRAIELLDLKKTDKVLDLFCGIGNFTLPISLHCEEVTGVEGDTGSVAQAKNNAALNNINNAQFHVANLFEDVSAMSFARTHYDKILLDPPRSGAKEVLPLINKWRPSRIVYVSCHTATIARDAEILSKLGYTLEKAGVMDMFPHTQHVEAIALFTRKS